MPFGDYGHYQRFNTSKNADLSVLAADAGPSTLVTCKSSGHQVFVQRITVEITTYSAKTWSFQDSAGTPVQVKLISIPAAAAALPSESNTMVFDFGPQGLPLTLGKNLTVTYSGAGAAGRIHVEAYEKLGSTPVALGTGPNGILN